MEPYLVPFGAFESLGGMMAFGGVSGMADSLLNQAFEGEFSLGKTLPDRLMGAATAGLLHGAGKALKGASKYAKNAVNKVISKNESALMNIAKKLDDVFAPVKLAQTPDGMTIPVKEETSRIQDAVSKIVDDAKGGGSKAKFDDLDGIRIINKKYAGKTYELSGDLADKYPNGVKFGEEGFPDFEPYSIKKVTVNNLEGDAYYDFIKANEAAGVSSTPKGYTWHHVEDGRTLILVPSDLHGAVRHTGGALLIRKGIRP